VLCRRTWLRHLTNQVISGLTAAARALNFVYMIQGRWEKVIEQINNNADFTVHEVD
jgi:hypothetical protein